MESEKVKEIKKVLEVCDKKNRGITILCGGEIQVIPYADILTLINELESENERLQRDYVVKAYDKLRAENKKLKDRLAELEKEIKENAFYSKGYAQGIKNTYEVVIPDKLKQFAERLKEKITVWYPSTIEAIDETLKGFIEK